MLGHKPTLATSATSVTQTRRVTFPTRSKRSLQGRNAAAKRWNRADRDDIAREYATQRLADYIAEVLRDVPGLTDHQYNQLAELLRPARRAAVQARLPTSTRGQPAVRHDARRSGAAWPTNLIFTTTKTRVHAENETRILSLSTDDSREQTARVLLELADESNGDRDLESWRDFQRWLADAEHRVTIPYARRLAQRVAPVAVRLRRDFGSLLALIRAHAVLHQASRERDAAGCIIATLDDYAVVRDLIADVIAEGVGATVSDTVRETVAAVRELASSEGVALRVIAEKLQLDKSNVSRRVRVAADGGYLRNLEDKRGKPSRWVIGDPLPESVDLLPDPAQLATASTTPDQECCGVAVGSEGENGGPSSNGQTGFIPPTGPSRCIACGWHVETQGHQSDCTVNS